MDEIKTRVHLVVIIFSSGFCLGVGVVPPGGHRIGIQNTIVIYWPGREWYGKKTSKRKRPDKVTRPLPNPFRAKIYRPVKYCPHRAFPLLPPFRSTDIADPTLPTTPSRRQSTNIVSLYFILGNEKQMFPVKLDGDVRYARSIVQDLC